MPADQYRVAMPRFMAAIEPKLLAQLESGDSRKVAGAMRLHARHERMFIDRQKNELDYAARMVEATLRANVAAADPDAGTMTAEAMAQMLQQVAGMGVASANAVAAVARRGGGGGV